MNYKCEVPRCTKDCQVIFYKHNVCWTHYEEHCKKKIDLKLVFKIVEAKA